MNIMKSRKKTIGIISILVLLFIIPVILAKFVYAHQQFLPKTTVNHGQLINPSLELDKLKLNPAPASGKWLLLLIQMSPCDQVCQQNLFYMRQIQQALGKNYDRLQRVVIVSDHDADPELLAMIKDPFAGTLLTQINSQQLKKVIPTPQTWYVADPLGNMMMSYASNAKPDDILADLEYLLRASQIG